MPVGRLGSTPLDSVVGAILRMEGADQPNSVNATIQRTAGLYNPGHIEYSSWSAAHGAQPVTIQGRTWAGWPTYDAGVDAVKALLAQYQRNDPGITIQQAVFKYAPPNENDSALYARNLASWTGLPVDTPLASVLTGSVPNPTKPPAGSSKPPEGTQTAQGKLLRGIAKELGSMVRLLRRKRP